MKPETNPLGDFKQVGDCLGNYLQRVEQNMRQRQSETSTALNQVLSRQKAEQK